jgi:hypothetical protein
MTHSSQPALPDPIAPEPLRVGAVPPARGPAELFLESVQQRVYGSVGLSAHDCQQHERAGQKIILPVRLQQKAAELPPDEFARYRSAVLEALTRDETLPRPTPFERPHQYSIVRDLKTSLESAAAQLSLPLPFRPVIGTLPTKLLEPLMLRVPASDQVVLVIDGQLLTFAHLLAKAVTQALPFEMLEGELFAPEPPAPGWEARIDPDGIATQRFVELMLAAAGGNVGNAPSYPPDPSGEQMTAALCECMELFLLAREYARLCEGDHLMAPVERRSAHGEAFEALTWTVGQELHADTLGLAIMLAAATTKGESARLAFWSADLLLSSLSVLERALFAIDHPSAPPVFSATPDFYTERRRQLRILVTLLDGGDRVVAFADAMDAVISTLAQRFEAVLQQLQYGSTTTH